MEEHDQVLEVLDALGGLRCPTCRGSKANRCCSCGVKLDGEDLELSPNPFAEEIHGCGDLHLQCKECRYQSAMDI